MLVRMSLNSREINNFIDNYFMKHKKLYDKGCSVEIIYISNKC